MIYTSVIFRTKKNRETPIKEGKGYSYKNQGLCILHTDKKNKLFKNTLILLLFIIVFL